MKISTSAGVAWGAAILLVFTGLVVGLSRTARGDSVSPPMQQLVTAHGVADDAQVDAPLDVGTARLARYLSEDVMASWPRAVIQDVDRWALALDIARAVLRKPSADPPSDGVILAVLAYIEGSRFAEYVDSQECNDPEWRAYGHDVGPEHRARESDGRFGAPTTIWFASELMHVGGDCDNKLAFSLWQIHPVSVGSPLYGTCSLDVIRADRSDAAFCAMEMVRLDGSLMAYTGGQREKAEERVEFAEKALREHPWRLPRE